MANWDVGRFLNTVSYFDAVPIFSDLRRLFTGESKDKSTIAGARRVGLVLVFGAMSEQGRSIVDRLLANGSRVRAIVGDLDSASLPDGVELIGAEDAWVLTPQMMAGVRSIVYCANLESNLTESSLEDLVTMAKTYLPTSTQDRIFDFTSATPNIREIWGSVDDVVMGGVSESGMGWSGASAIFSGRVSIDNSGGFASVRTRNFEPTFDLSNYTGIELRVKGDGQRYKLFIRTETAWDGVGYACSFDTNHDWITVKVPFDKLVPVFRAKIVNPSPQFDRTQIRSFQLMLSKFEYDRELNPRFTPGLFALEIESITAYGDNTLPQLTIVEDPAHDFSATILTPAALSLLDKSNLPYTIIRSGRADLQAIATIVVKAQNHPTSVGKILGSPSLNN
jgi:hypothetical protein